MKYLAIIMNWRIVAITLLAAATLFLAMCDGEDVLIVFGTKVLAVIAGYITHVLARRWEGKMPELDIFNGC